MNIKLTLFILKFFRIILSIVTLSIIAKYFGDDISRDNWLLAYSVFIFIDLAVWGPVNETFRAKFVELKNVKEEIKAVSSARSLFKFVNYSTILLAILLFVLAPLISDILKPEIGFEDKEQLTFMLRIISPSLVINQVNLLLTSVLNAYEVFYIPEIAGIISVFFNIILILLFVNTLGIYSLFLGHYFSLLLLLLLIFLQFKNKRLSFFYQKVKFKFDDAKIYLIFAIPFFFPYFIGQLSFILEKYIAGLIGVSTISNLDYSRRFLDIPINVITSLMATLYIPKATKYFFSQKMEEFRLEFDRFFDFGYTIILSISSFLILFSDEIVDFLFNRGAISNDNLHIINNTTQLYSISSMSIFLYSLSGFTLLASEKAKSYAIYGVLTQVFIIMFNVSIFSYLGIYTFPITFLVFHLVSSILMLFILKKENRIISFFRVIKLTFLFFLLTIALIFIEDYFYINNMWSMSSLLFKSGILTIILIPLGYRFFKKNLSFIK